MDIPCYRSSAPSAGTLAANRLRYIDLNECGKSHIAPRYRSGHQPHPVLTSSLDQLVGGGEERFGDGEAERLSCTRVDDEFELGRLLHWEV
jgi:hypothetical protein